MTRFVFALVAVAAFAAVGESAVRSRGVRGGCGCATPSAVPSTPAAYPGMPMAAPGAATPAPCCGNPGSVPGAVAPFPVPAGTPGGHQHNHGLLTPSAAGSSGVVTVSATVPAGGLVLVKDKADPAKEVKLTGTLVCGKCSLKATAKCSNVLQVKDGDKVVNYFLEDKGNGEPYHEGVCGGDKVEGVTVTGTVTEKDGKKSIKPTKVETKK
ncbi:MAG: hypothetical protein C0467_23525 [Planctomycetaceae bacterium]|nr:hypothetical protein [Planctomycetaceae bacterium]